MKTKDLKEMLGRPRAFPLELTLTTGGKHIVPHPDYIHVGPRGTVFLFGPHGTPDEGIDHRRIVKMRPLRRAS